MSSTDPAATLAPPTTDAMGMADNALMAEIWLCARATGPQIAEKSSAPHRLRREDGLNSRVTLLLYG
jgi:hypothetical protein